MLHSIGAPRAVLFLCAFLLSCTTTPTYSRGALFEQILRPYPAHPNMLVNQACVKYERGVCIQIDTVLFDLKKEEDKKQLRDLKFICKVGAERFGICFEGAGLCQMTKAKLCRLCVKKYIVIKQLDIERDFQFILNSNTLCAAQDSFIGKRLFN